MFARIRGRVGVAHLIAFVALLVALGSGAYALTLPKNSVKSKQIKNGQVKTADLARGAVKGSRVANGSLGISEFAHSLPAARVDRTSDQSIPAATSTAINFNDERYDTANLHSASTNNDRLTAHVNGIYELSASVVWANNGTGSRQLALMKNLGTPGQTLLAVNDDVPVSNGGTNQSVSTVARLQAGDYVDVLVTQFTSPPASLSVVDQNEFSPEFEMTWLAPGP